MHILLSANLLQYLLLFFRAFFMHNIIVMTIRINVAIRNTPPGAPATMGTMLNSGDPLRNKEDRDPELQSEQTK